MGAMLPLRPPSQLDDSLIQVIRNEQLAGLKRPVLPKREVQAPSHLHFTQAQLRSVPRKVLRDDREHESG